MLLIACGTDIPVGECREEGSVACTCADGSVGTRACGVLECSCPSKSECREGETTACVCPGGLTGTKACGAAECVCDESGCGGDELVDRECLAVGPAALALDRIGYSMLRFGR